MMTLEKFEEASELVKKVTNPTKLVFSEYLSTQNRKICSIQEHTRSGELTIRSVR